MLFFWKIKEQTAERQSTMLECGRHRSEHKKKESFVRLQDTYVDRRWTDYDKVTHDVSLVHFLVFSRAISNSIDV
jgi:hypothetical protein